MGSVPFFREQNSFQLYTGPQRCIRLQFPGSDVLSSLANKIFELVPQTLTTTPYITSNYIYKSSNYTFFIICSVTNWKRESRKVFEPGEELWCFLKSSKSEFYFWGVKNLYDQTSCTGLQQRGCNGKKWPAYSPIWASNEEEVLTACIYWPKTNGVFYLPQKLKVWAVIGWVTSIPINVIS